MHRLLAKQVKQFPDLEIAELDTEGLDPRDAALAHAIYDTVIRRWMTIQHLLSFSLDKPWDEMHPKVAAPMLAGAAQIIFFDKVPIHAAVDEAVKAAKAAGPRSGGLVNAVLRTLVRELGGDENGLTLEKRPTWIAGRNEVPSAEGGALGFKRDVLPPDPMQALAIGTSHSLELLRLWAKHFPMHEVRRLAYHDITAPPTILNTSFAVSPLPEGVLTAHTSPGHHVWTGSHAELCELLRSRRDIWVQDPGSALAVAGVADLNPSVVIDVCAGMGTKTRQLAAAFPDARVITTDIDLPRYDTLREVFKGVSNVDVVPYQKLKDLSGQANLVLLDVPCSNSGTLARRTEARYRFDRDRSEKLVSMQKQIIADSIPLLKVGGGGSGRGRLLYSTCSLDPAENGEQARWAAKWHMFKVTRERSRLPEGGPGEPAEKYSDGSYAVLLE